MADKPDGRRNNGGPQPKVRADDARGSPPGTFGQPDYVPNEIDRQTVIDYAVVIPTRMLARHLGIGVDTLRRHYRKELDGQLFKATATIGAKVYTKANNGDRSAQYYFLNTRGGYTEREAPIAQPTAADDGEVFAVPPEVLADLSDEEWALYERICDRVAAAQSGGAAGGPAVEGEGEGPPPPPGD